MSSLAEIILANLKGSEFWTNRTRITGNTIQNLVCPECGDKSAWAYSNSPMAICCNKMSACGARVNTIDLFQIRRNFEKEYAPTKADKHRPAREYLRSRGIEKVLKGLVFEYWPKVRGLANGAVMFPVTGNAQGKEKQVYNGRIFPPIPKGEGKTHNQGSTSGLYWQHPGMEYDRSKPVYIVEGIVDALSLTEMGLQSFAVLSSGQDPIKLQLEEWPLILAFDNDTAGRKATEKYLAAYPNSTAIMPDRGTDWNDFLCKYDEAAGEELTRQLDTFKANAQLALAVTGKEYAGVYYQHFQKTPGLFTHRGITHYSWLKRKGDDSTVITERVGLFTIRTLSYFVDTSDPDRAEYNYHLAITPHGGQTIKALATGKELSTRPQPH